jgi:hypothetical protein
LKVLVYDVSGALVTKNTFFLNKGNNVFSIDTDAWKLGTYIVQLVTPNQTLHKKLIKQTESVVE